MDYWFGFLGKLAQWFTPNTANKRKRDAPEVNENLNPKRFKLLHSQNQTDASLQREYRPVLSRTEKLQAMAHGSTDRSYAGSGFLLTTRQPQSWLLKDQRMAAMKENSMECSSDEECSDNEVQIVSETRVRQPLSSSPLQNNVESNPSSDSGIQVIQVVKNKTPKPNGLHNQLLHGSIPGSQLCSSKKTNRFLTPSTRREISSRSSNSSRLLHPSSRCGPGTSGCRFTAHNMEIQLHDKVKYGALLKSVISSNVSASSTPSSFTNLRDLEKNLQEIPEGMPLPRRRLSTPKSQVDYIDLTKPEKSRRPVYLKVQPPPKEKEDDDDIQIVGETLPVPVPRVNSYEKKLTEFKFLPEWLFSLKEHYQNVRNITEEQVKDEKIKKDIYAKQNEKALATVEERVRRHMTITETVILDEPVEEEPSLPVLTPEMQKQIDAALVPHPPSAVIAEGFGLRITRKDMHTLAKLNWLNDEVINFYMNLLIERGKQKDMPKVYAFNTFFYPKLISNGHVSLKRWTRKVDVFAHDLLIVPVHLGVHWCMAVLDLKKKVVEYYDSMGHPNNKCLNALLKYLEDESLDKKNKPYNTSDWKTINKTDIPQQMNGSDCGMFACTFAEYKCRNAKINFSQDDMKYFRRKMVFEILTGKLMLGN